MNLHNYKLATKIGGVFAIIVALVVLLGATALFQLNEVAKGEEFIVTSSEANVKLCADILAQVNTIRRLEGRHVLAQDDASMDKIEIEMATARKEIEKLEPAAVQAFDSDFEKKAWSSFKSNQEAWYAKWAELRPISRKSSNSAEMQDRATTLFNTGSQDAFVPVLKDIQDLTDFNLKEVESTWEEAQKTVSSAGVAITVCILVVIAMSVGMGVVLSRAISRPIAAAVDVAKAISTGDMTVAIHFEGKDETAQLLGAMRDMREGLVGVVSNVRRGADSVATASSEIAQGNQDLSSRTESQASALEQTAASMEELSSQVKHNADNAKQADQLAQSASSQAVRGGEVVGRVVETMKDIDASSKKISDIIGVIDGIAFQTNILALNAAVEAARAGDQGRGFAVVAGEVRALAGRSAEAAREIKSLITANVERVEHGSALVDEAGSTMTAVVGAIRRVSDLVGEISAASDEQASGVAQVGEAVTQMDQATQQNAALVEQMAAAASSLKVQSGELVDTVSIFRLGEGNNASKTAVRTSSIAEITGIRAKSRPIVVNGDRKGVTNGNATLSKVTSLQAPRSKPKPITIAKDSKLDGEDWESF